MQRSPARQPPPPNDDDWWWIFDPRYSLRARAALLFGGSAMLFTVLVAWSAGVLLQRQIQANLGATFETLAVQVSDKVDRVIHQRFHELQLVANLAPFTRPDGDPAERRRVLESLQLASRDFAWIGFADPAGHIVSATRGVLERTVAEERAWFRNGRERPFVSTLHDVTLPAGAGDADPDRLRVLDFAVPVIGTRGQFLGVLAAHVRWDWATEVRLSVVPESARRERLGVTIYSATNEVLLDSDGSGWSLPPDAPALPPASRFRGIMLESTPMGTSYLTGYTRSRGFREFRGLGWLVTVRQPIDRAFAPVQQLRTMITKWGFLLSGALMVTSWLGAARISRRMRGIAAAARRIREGDIFAVMPRPKGERDLERMCDAVGDLVEELRPRQEPPAADDRPGSAGPGDGYVKPTGSDPRRVIW